MEGNILDTIKLITGAKGAPSISKVDTGTHDLYTVLFNDGIIEPNVYFNFIALLDRLQKGSRVIVLINSPGGYVTSGRAVIAAMKRCKGEIITVNLGIAASCGAMIWSEGHKRYMAKHAQLMYHTASQWESGKSRDIRDNTENTETHLDIWFKSYVDKGLITQTEYDKVFRKRSDLFLLSTDMRGRDGVYILGDDNATTI